MTAAEADPQGAGLEIVRWIRFARWRLGAHLPEASRIALAEVAIGLDLALHRGGVEHPSLLAKAILNDTATLHAALCGTQRWVGDPDFTKVIDRALSDLMSVVLALNRRPRFLWFLPMLIQHANAVAVLATYLVSPVTVRETSITDELARLLRRHFARVRDSRLTWFALSFRPLFWGLMWILVRQVLSTMSRFPRHNPWKYKGEIARFFSAPSAKRLQVFSSMLAWARAINVGAPVSVEELTNATSAIISSTEIPVYTLGCQVYEAVWGMFSQNLEPTRVARALSKLFDQAIARKAEGHAQSCLFIIYQMLCVRRGEADGRSYAEAFDTYRGMIDRWLRRLSPGKYVSGSGNTLQILHLYRFTRVASWIARPGGRYGDATEVFRHWLERMPFDEDNAATLLEEILYLGYEFNLWDAVIHLLPIWRERMEREGGAPALRAFFEAHLRRLRRQRPDRAYDIYRNLRPSRARSRASRNTPERLRVDERPTPERGFTCALEDSIYYFLPKLSSFRQQTCEIYLHSLQASGIKRWLHFVVSHAARVVLAPTTSSKRA